MPFKKNDPKAKEWQSKGGKASSQKRKDWDDIGAYLLAIGSDRFIREIDQLEGKEYVQAFKDILEYFKPKLARLDSNVNNTGEIKIILEDYGHTDSTDTK